LVLAWYALATRAWRRAAWAAGALGAGVALSAFYWLAVLLEWDLVQGDLAIARPYQYFLHWVEPPELLGFASRGDLIDVDLGMPLVALVAVSTLLLALSVRTVAAAQWRLAGMLWLLAAVAVFLMSSISEPVWAALPLLQRLQFPWRLLALLSIAAAALAGSAPRFGRVVMVVGVATLALGMVGRRPAPERRHLLPAAPAEIATRFVRPDVMNEWLPRGAVAFDPFKVPHLALPRCKPHCRVTGFTRSPGRLAFGVQGQGPEGRTVTLPHYAFPVGWTVHVAGATVPRVFLPPNLQGLMRLVVRPGEQVELTFRTTPGRRLAAVVSGVSSLLLLLLVAMRLPRSDATSLGSG
jgi:hypothetical protein